MIIRSARFVTSSSKFSQCPEANIPEFAFIGRSNVGKSSLINLLTGHAKLAKTSGQPGKTQTINHFIINEEWYLTDLPGYGYAKVSRSTRSAWQKLISEYISGRENLICLFVLLDSRHEPLDADMEFMEFLGTNQVPFARVFTKADKQSQGKLERIIELHGKRMLETWESLPAYFVSSVRDSRGREELLSYIEESMTFFRKPGDL